MNAKGFLGILNNLDMLSDKDIKKALGRVKPSHLTAALRNQKLRQPALRLLAKQPALLKVLQSGGQSLIARVERLAHDKDGITARLAIQVLGLLPQDATQTKALRRISLRAFNPEVKSTLSEKKRALVALGVMRDADAVNLVRHTAKNDRLATIRSAAWIALAGMGELGRRQLIAEARSQIRRRSMRPDLGLIKALGLVTDEAASDLLTQFFTSNYRSSSEEQAIVTSLISQGTERSFRRLADVVCHIRSGRDSLQRAVRHLASQKPTAAHQALLRIARKKGTFCMSELIALLANKPGRSVIRFLLQQATGSGPAHRKDAEDALIRHRGKQVFNVLRDVAMTGTDKEAQAAKRIIRKRGETDKFREHLLANL